MESHEDSCIDQPGGKDGLPRRTCVHDGSFTELRRRSESGAMITVRNYAGHANDPEALEAVRSFLREYRHPSGALYRPQKAALFIRAYETTQSVGRGWPDSFESWPLERRLLEPGDVLESLNGRHQAKVRADGTLVAADVTGSIHKVGAELQGAPSCNGWTYWCFKRDGQRVPIDVLRQQVRAELDG